MTDPTEAVAEALAQWWEATWDYQTYSRPEAPDVWDILAPALIVGFDIPGVGRAMIGKETTYVEVVDRIGSGTKTYVPYPDSPTSSWHDTRGGTTG